jgi:hypothetical protein
MLYNDKDMALPGGKGGLVVQKKHFLHALLQWGRVARACHT